MAPYLADDNGTAPLVRMLWESRSVVHLFLGTLFDSLLPFFLSSRLSLSHWPLCVEDSASVKGRETLPIIGALIVESFFLRAQTASNNFTFSLFLSSLQTSLLPGPPENHGA